MAERWVLYVHELVIHVIQGPGICDRCICTHPTPLCIHTLTLAVIHTHTPAGDSRLTKREDRFLVSFWEEREK